MYGLIDRYRFSKIVKKVEKDGDIELIMEYLEGKNYLPPDKLEIFVELLCENPEGYYLYSIVENIKNISVSQINKITNAILKTDSAYYIKAYLDKLYELSCISKTTNDRISKRLCELKNVGVLKDLLLTNKELSEEYHAWAMKIIVENDSIKNVCEIAKESELITEADKKIIVKRVCDEKNPYYICLVSRLFSELKKDYFVLAMEKTSDPEMLYCFIKYNPELDSVELNILVDKLCKLGDIKYIYECLNVIHDRDLIAKRTLMKAIRKSDDVKYKMLACFYTEGILTHEKYNFDSLYPYMLNSDLYTSQELVDVYKVYVKKVAQKNKKK